MAYNDYFVIVYQLLKYLYECVKEGTEPNVDRLKADTYEIPESYWRYIAESLLDGGCIQGVTIKPTKDGTMISGYRHMTITPKGIEYLYENTLIQKIKRHLKDIKDVTPFA